MIEKQPILTKNFIFTFMAQFFIAMVMYTLITTIGEYVTYMGATAMIAGMVSGIYIFGGLISRLFSGTLLGKYGWKRTAVFFLILHFLANCCYFLINNVWLLLFIRFFHGIGFGAAANSIMVIGMASLPKSRYGEATGYFMLSTSLAIAVGPYIGGIIYDSFGGNGCFISASIFSLLSTIFMFLTDTDKIEPIKNPTYKNSSVQKTSGIKKFLEPKALPISLCILFLSFGYASLIAFYRLYASSENMIKEFSPFFLIYAVILVISRLVVGKIQDAYGDSIVCYPSFVIQSVGIAFLAWKPCIASIIFCAIAGALGYGTMNSCLNTIVNRNVENNRRPFIATTYWSCCDIGVGIGPTFLGAIVSSFGYHVMYFTAAMLSLIAVPVFFIATKNK